MITKITPHNIHELLAMNEGFRTVSKSKEETGNSTYHNWISGGKLYVMTNNDPSSTRLCDDKESWDFLTYFCMGRKGFKD